jgi:hypothetical protein
MPKLERIPRFHNTSRISEFGRFIGYELAGHDLPEVQQAQLGPHVTQVEGKYGQVYRYQVYRHPDGRRRTPLNA